jgi:hypothetical protein
MIRFPCSFCKGQLDAADQDAGGKMPCPHCQCLTAIPDHAVRAAAPPPDHRPLPAPSSPAPDVTGDMPRSQLDWLREHLQLNIPPSFAALGPIEVAAFTPRPPRQVALIFIIFFGSLLLLMAIILALMAAYQNVWVALAILGGGVAIVSLFGLAGWGLMCGFRRFACVACPRGFLWRRGQILRQYRWDQIQAPYFDYNVGTEKINGQPVQLTWYDIARLVMDDGATLRFPGRVQVFRAIGKHIYTLHYPRAEQAVRAGQLVPFGDRLALSRDLLVWRNETTPWHRVSHLFIDDESLTLRLLGDPRDRDLGSPLNVPNVEVLIDLSNSLAKAAHDEYS